jgi:N-hydroxyarylamine O-acetyltransferase
MLDISAFEPERYLKRIHHFVPVRLTEDGLGALHRAQICAIPFENFDVLLGRGISLEPAKVFNKLVRKARGGYCFELNGLFLMALQAFGFKARALLARVHRHGAPSGRGHQISLVTVQGREWIADVGFGSPHLPAPIPLELGYAATLDGREFRLAEAGPFGTMLQTLNDGVWQNLYSFDKGYVCQGDIAYGNHYTSTHPDSFFTFARVAALPSPGGRISLFDRTLRISTADTDQVAELEEGRTYLDALKYHFGIELDISYEALPPLRVQKADAGKIVVF